MHTAQAGATRLSIRTITKTFDGVVALSGVSFDVSAGSIHALLGANGAGKSTLIKILSGFYRADAGDILLDGEESADGAQIAFIHQDLALIGDLSVAENIAIIRGYPRRGPGISWKTVRAQAQSAIDAVGGGIDVEAKVNTLTRADQSLVAIARGVSMDCRVVVLDEPTASLPEADVERLFAILRSLKERGVSILYVSHRLDEIRQIADRVTVLRDGKVRVDQTIEEISDQQIVDAIVGSAIVRTERRKPLAPRSDALTVRGGSVAGGRVGFDLTLGRGEVLGLAGLRGAGHEQIGRGLAGIVPFAADAVLIEGSPAHIANVRAAIADGIGFATSRREQEALAMTLTARENFYLNPGIAKTYRFPQLASKNERKKAVDLADRVRLRPQNPEAVVATFSGGNQQKVVLGRWLSVDLRVLILEEPTMGIDVGARAEIYALIHELADNGLGIIVVSTDFEELALLCERALVFDRGTIRVELAGEKLTSDALTYHASGSVQEGPQ